MIIPGGFLLVFSEQLDPGDNKEMIAEFRQQLSSIHLEVKGRDIYDNKISVNTSLVWFMRHSKKEEFK